MIWVPQGRAAPAHDVIDPFQGRAALEHDVIDPFQGRAALEHDVIDPSRVGRRRNTT